MVEKSLKKGPYTVDDKSLERCQCVMRHYDFLEGGLSQCGSKRVSNLFCKGCEEVHGDYWRIHHPEDYAS